MKQLFLPSRRGSLEVYHCGAAGKPHSGLAERALARRVSKPHASSWYWTFEPSRSNSPRTQEFALSYQMVPAK